MKPLIQRVLRSRADLVELGVVALFLGLGVNLLATWLDKYLQGFPPSQWQWLTAQRVELLIAALLIVIGVWFFVRVLLRDRVIEKQFEGVILFNKEKRKSIPIYGYKFARMLSDTLRAVFIENQALKTAWDAEPLFKNFHDKKSDEASNNKNKDEPDKGEVSYVAICKCEFSPQDNPVSEKSILIEGVEFCVLELLSLHLSEHFDNMEGCEHEVTTIKREDIPGILLQNRILSLLSTPIEDRQIFITSGIDKNPPKGELHAIYASNGAQYSRFDLMLPKGTKIIRPEPGSIKLEHKRFELEIHISFQGFCKNLPAYFEDLYVGIDEESVDARIVKFQVYGKLQRRALLLFNGWRYYEWIDSFFNYFEQSVSFETFLKNIDWASVATRIRSSLILESKRAMANSKRKERIQATGKTSGESRPSQN
ncbi:MAG: hypothetical protein HZC54_23295 [Verrucomicrobia bacterium]|nr:hypothetical protein [Verrucomicrobiota bacterium]